MTWIWKRDDWPDFRWDGKFVRRRAAGIVPGIAAIVENIDDLPENNRTETMIDLMVSEAMKTSEIEGERHAERDVRAFIIHHMGLGPRPAEPADEGASGIAEMTVSARKHFDEPLSKERLQEWQSMIFRGDPADKGRWRTCGVAVASGPPGRRLVHYRGPPPERVPDEMDRFIQWFNDGRNETDPVIRAGVSHVRFEAIHPFADGNGRVGRAISDIAISQGLGRPAPISMSTAITKRLDGYYRHLETAGMGNLDITRWLRWFSDTARLAQTLAMKETSWDLFHARLWRDHSRKLSMRQTMVLLGLAEQGVERLDKAIGVAEYARLARCGKDEARRDLAELRDMGAARALPRFDLRRRYKLNIRGRRRTRRPAQPDPSYTPGPVSSRRPRWIRIPPERPANQP